LLLAVISINSYGFGCHFVHITAGVKRIDFSYGKQIIYRYYIFEVKSFHS